MSTSGKILPVTLRAFGFDQMTRSFRGAHLRAGLNVYEGAITYRAVADALKLPYVPAEQALRM